MAVKNNIMPAAPRWVRCEVNLDIGAQYSRAADGTTRSKLLRPTLWRAAYTTQVLDKVASGIIRTRLNDHEAAGSLFRLWDVRRAWPASVSSGTGLDAVEILSVNADRRHIALTGLPANFALTEGDHLAFTHDSGTIRVLHRLTESISANGAGYTAQFRVDPVLIPGAEAGLAVDLYRPYGWFRVEPGSIAEEMAGPRRSRVSFSAAQVLQDV